MLGHDDTAWEKVERHYAEIEAQEGGQQPPEPDPTTATAEPSPDTTTPPVPPASTPTGETPGQSNGGKKLDRMDWISKLDQAREKRTAALAKHIDELAEPHLLALADLEKALETGVIPPHLEVPNGTAAAAGSPPSGDTTTVSDEQSNSDQPAEKGWRSWMRNVGKKAR